MHGAIHEHKPIDDASWLTHPANVDRQRNVYAHLPHRGFYTTELWTCGMICHSEELILKDIVLQECDKVDCGEKTVVKYQIEAFFQRYLDQGIMLKDPKTQGLVWRGLTPDAVQSENVGELYWLYVENLLERTGARYYSKCHIWQRHHPIGLPSLQLPLNMTAYRALQGCGVPEIILASDVQGDWIVTNYCGLSLKEWQEWEMSRRRGALLCRVTEYTIGSMLRDNLRKIHERGWSINAPMTSDSIFVDCKEGKELSTSQKDPLPPYGLGPGPGCGREVAQHDPAKAYWQPVVGAWFINLGLAKPNATKEEQEADVSSLRELFGWHRLVCDEFGVWD